MRPIGVLSLFCALAVLGFASAPTAWAQRGEGGGDRGDWRERRGGGDDRGDREERGRDRGDRDRGDRGDRGREDRGRDRDERRGREEDNRSPEERRREFMQRLDRNGDGKVEASELDDRWRGWFEQEMKSSGLDPSKPITAEQFIRARAGQDLQKQREENPTAFIAPLPPEPVPGFDTLLSEDELLLLNPDKERPFVLPTASATTTGTTPPPSRREGGNEGGDPGERMGRGGFGGRSFGGPGGGFGGPGGGPGGFRGREEGRDRGRGERNLSDRIQDHAKGIMEKHDTDKNSIIEGDEYANMATAKSSDLDGDGRVTLDELIKRANNEGGSTSSRPERPRRDRSDRDSGAKSGRSSYRFTSPLDRLSSSARSWVERYDDNNDGQVSMAEFSTSWTDSKVREFQRYDANGDGIVTGDEYSSDRGR